MTAPKMIPIGGPNAFTKEELQRLGHLTQLFAACAKNGKQIMFEMIKAFPEEDQEELGGLLFDHGLTCFFQTILHEFVPIDVQGITDWDGRKARYNSLKASLAEVFDTIYFHYLEKANDDGTE